MKISFENKTPKSSSLSIYVFFEGKKVNMKKYENTAVKEIINNFVNSKKIQKE